MGTRTPRSKFARTALVVSLVSGATVTGAVAVASSRAPGQRVSGQAAARTVRETDQLQFQPMMVNVVPGDVVEWTNTGSVPHNVTFDQYPDLTSGTMNGRDRYEIRFTTTGNYHYRCTFHPGMNGTVTVSRS